MVNLRSASFVVIMLLKERLTGVHSQKDPRLHFGESVTLKKGVNNICGIVPSGLVKFSSYLMFLEKALAKESGFLFQSRPEDDPAWV